MKQIHNFLNVLAHSFTNIVMRDPNSRLLNGASVLLYNSFSLFNSSVASVWISSIVLSVLLIIKLWGQYAAVSWYNCLATKCCSSCLTVYIWRSYFAPLGFLNWHHWVKLFGKKLRWITVGWAAYCLVMFWISIQFWLTLGCVSNYRSLICAEQFFSQIPSYWTSTHTASSH